MRALPLITPNPGTGRVLPTPVVRSAVVNQVVDLKPAGNTIALTTTSDNPFESNRKISVVTQASGGMASAPASMRSHRLAHSFMPGLGETATGEAAVKQNAGSVFTDTLTAAGNAFTQYNQSQVAEQQRLAQEAEARAAEWKARADIEQSKTQQIIAAGGRAFDATNVSVGGYKFNWALVGLGVVGVGVAIYLSKKKKK